MAAGTRSVRDCARPRDAAAAAVATSEPVRSALATASVPVAVAAADCSLSARPAAMYSCCYPPRCPASRIRERACHFLVLVSLEIRYVGGWKFYV